MHRKLSCGDSKCAPSVIEKYLYITLYIHTNLHTNMIYIYITSAVTMLPMVKSIQYVKGNGIALSSWTHFTS